MKQHPNRRKGWLPIEYEFIPDLDPRNPDQTDAWIAWCDAKQFAPMRSARRAYIPQLNTNISSKDCLIYSDSVLVEVIQSQYLLKPDADGDNEAAQLIAQYHSIQRALTDLLRASDEYWTIDLADDEYATLCSDDSIMIWRRNAASDPEAITQGAKYDRLKAQFDELKAAHAAARERKHNELRNIIPQPPTTT